MGRLQESFHDLKDYCTKINYVDNDCAILETNWSNVLNRIEFHGAGNVNLNAKAIELHLTY